MSCIKSPSGSLGITTFLLFFSAFFLLANVRGSDGPPASKVQQVAPGIWRIRFGHPEQFTPTSFRTAPVARDDLKNMKPDPRIPFDPTEIVFGVSDRGCSVCLPMKRQESVYGFGLHTELFDMTQSKDGQTGRRVVLAPTDMPENDLGESHARCHFMCLRKVTAYLWIRRVSR